MIRMSRREWRTAFAFRLQALGWDPILAPFDSHPKTRMAMRLVFRDADSKHGKGKRRKHNKAARRARARNRGNR